MCTYSSSCATMPNNVQCLSWLCAMHDPAWPDALGPSPLTHGHNTRRGHLHPVRGTPTVAFAGHAFSFISDIWIGNDGRGIKQGNPLTQGQTAGNSILVGNTNMHLHENQTDRILGKPLPVTQTLRSSFSPRPTKLPTGRSDRIPNIYFTRQAQSC